MRSMSYVICLCVVLSVRTNGGEKGVLVGVRNPAGFERKGETVSVSRDELKRRELVLAGSARLVVTDRQTGESIPCQWDEGELIFQSSFKPHEEKQFVVSETDREVSTFPPLVDGRFEKPREDYAWENDRIAFRMYGPALAAEVNNGIDVWTKRVRYLIVDKWYSESAAAGTRITRTMARELICSRWAGPWERAAAVSGSMARFASRAFSRLTGLSRPVPFA